MRDLNAFFEDWTGEIRKASERLATFLHPTPLVESKALSDRFGHRVLLKLESQQPTGAFKVRPAFNSILSDLQRARDDGVVTNSSGNFAQAVAYAATATGVDASIVMMRGASAYKRTRTERFGGHVVLCDNTFSSRAETTKRIQLESGRLLVHPYNTRETIAGNGTIGLELLEQVAEDFTLIAPVSGGGLIAGIALAVKSVRPGCRVFGVQPEANPSMKRSLDAGQPVRINPGRSLADALAVPEPGSNTFPIARQLVEDVLLVGEEGMASAIRALAVEQKLVAEGGGAAPLAALEQGIPDGDAPIVCVISGGNIAPDRFRSLWPGPA